ncbi:hypothetical protein HHI36_020121 [Cryptolaemus montrouzieri]|uniref:Uncharacterized protein n=1 Tax=Cryptolaemus montrouzieri TaxID=559131 RepID=A0ABD2N9Z6_9CUCU
MIQGQQIASKDSMHLLGITVYSRLSWHKHVSAIVKSALTNLVFFSEPSDTSRHLSCCFYIRRRFDLLWNIVPMYGDLRPNICCGCMEKRDVRLIDHPEITLDLQPLAPKRQVADLSLFHRYFHRRCSKELKDLIRRKLMFCSNTMLTRSSHHMAVHLTSRTSLYKNSFVYRAGELWKSLPFNIFPTSYNLALFKKRHLNFSQVATHVV